MWLFYCQLSTKYLFSGGDILHSSIANSLPTLPFEVLKTLYDGTPLSTDDGLVLRRLSINLGVVHMLLACLGIFTHQASNSEKDSQNNKNKDDRSQLYWAKGTVTVFNVYHNNTTCNFQELGMVLVPPNKVGMLNKLY